MAKAKKKTAPKQPKKKKGFTSRRHRAAANGERPPVRGGELILPPARPGPVSKYTEEMAFKVLDAIAGGASLIRACSDEGMPDARTVVRWTIKHPEFKAAYDEAREIQAHVWAAQLKDIADNVEIGSKTTETLGGKNGDTTQTTTADMIEHRKLKCDTIRWLLPRMNSKYFSEKLVTENTNTNNTTLRIEVVERRIIDPKVIEHKAR